MPTLRIRRLAAIALLAMTAISRPSAAADRDHLVCYTITDESSVPPAIARLENQLAIQGRCKVTARTRLLCEETSVDDGDDPRGAAAQRFLCHRLRCAETDPAIKRRTLVVGDATAPDSRRVTLGREEMVCAPFTLEDGTGAPCTPAADCSGDAYCATPSGACHVSGTCTARPQICIDLYDPVCGCDGQTYSNACRAAALGVNVAQRGTCP